MTKSADLDCVRVVRFESDLDELVAESDSLLVVLRCRGDGNGDSDIVEASADSFQRLATARAEAVLSFSRHRADLAPWWRSGSASHQAQPPSSAFETG